MNIAVVGLGLIGGSLCKAIKHRTKHLCFGLDKSGETLHAALNQGAIDRAIEPEGLSQADLTLVCLHPGRPSTLSWKTPPIFARAASWQTYAASKKRWWTR